MSDKIEVVSVIFLYPIQQEFHTKIYNLVISNHPNFATQFKKLRIETVECFSLPCQAKGYGNCKLNEWEVSHTVIASCIKTKEAG